MPRSGHISAPSESPGAGGDWRGLAAAIAAITSAAFGLAITHPLFALLMEAQGLSGLAIGISTAMLSVGILTGGLFMPTLLRHVDLATLMIGAAAVGAGLLVLARAFDDYLIWCGLRLLFSLCATALFFGSEIWIMTAAPPARRGLWLGIYGLALSVGFLAGPSLLLLVGTAGWTPFLISGALVLLAVVPIFLARDRAPTNLSQEGGGVRATLRFFRSDPVLVAAVVVASAFEFGALGLLPVWGLRIGMTEAAAVALVAMVPLGNILFEVPMGLLSDRLPRYRLIFVSALGALACGLLLPVLADRPQAVSLLLLLAGGLVIGLYTFPMAEFAARLDGPQLAQANGAIIFAYGVGALVSPVLLGQLLDMFPPHGLASGITAMAGAFLALMAWKARAAA